jgi:hypothetical protein
MTMTAEEDMGAVLLDFLSDLFKRIARSRGFVEKS